MQVLLHCLGAKHEQGTGTPTLTALALAEAQTLLWLLRGGHAMLRGAALALLRASDGAVLAATPSYYGAMQSGGAQSRL